MAANKFKPKVSSNIIEGATPTEEVEVTKTPDNEEAVKATAEENTPEQVEEDLSEGATPTDTDVEPEKETETPVEDSNTEPEEKSETAPPTVTFEPTDEETKQPLEKNVKVCSKVNHSCVIGGVAYHFEKGKQVNVPLSVKTILMQADLLMPL